MGLSRSPENAFGVVRDALCTRRWRRRRFSSGNSSQRYVDHPSSAEDAERHEKAARHPTSGSVCMLSVPRYAPITTSVFRFGNFAEEALLLSGSLKQCRGDDHIWPRFVGNLTPQAGMARPNALPLSSLSRQPSFFIFFTSRSFSTSN